MVAILEKENMNKKVVCWSAHCYALADGKIICSYKNTTVIKMWVFIPKIHTKISNKSITMQKFELVAFKNSKLCSVKPSNNVSE